MEMHPHRTSFNYQCTVLVHGEYMGLGQSHLVDHWIGNVDPGLIRSLIRTFRKLCGSIESTIGILFEETDLTDSLLSPSFHIEF